MIRSEALTNKATTAYQTGKEFLCDHVSRFKVIPIATTSPLINIKVDSQRRSMKGILLLFVKKYNAGAEIQKNTSFLTSIKSQ